MACVGEDAKAAYGYTPSPLVGLYGASNGPDRMLEPTGDEPALPPETPTFDDDPRGLYTSSNSVKWTSRILSHTTIENFRMGQSFHM